LGSYASILYLIPRWCSGHQLWI